MPTACPPRAGAAQGLEGGSEAEPWGYGHRGQGRFLEVLVEAGRSPVSCPESCLVILAPAFHRLGAAPSWGNLQAQVSWTLGRLLALDQTYGPEQELRAPSPTAAWPGAGLAGGGLPGRKVLCSRLGPGGQPAWWDGAAQNFRGASQAWKQRSECLFQLFRQPGARCQVPVRQGQSDPEHPSQHAAGAWPQVSTAPAKRQQEGPGARAGREATSWGRSVQPGARLLPPENTASLCGSGGCRHSTAVLSPAAGTETRLQGQSCSMAHRLHLLVPAS